MPARVFGNADRRVVLSMLWVFVVFNYLYADLVILIFRPGSYQTMAGRMSPSIAVGVTLLMELLLAMALLSRVLTSAFSRWANIIGGVVGTGFVAGTLSPRVPVAYLALASIEIACTLFIIWYAWTWRPAREND